MIEESPRILAFANGLRLVYTPVTTTRLAFVSVVVNVGSRDEGPAQLGMAHFLEHMVFKGTEKRKAFHILNRIDSVGGDLNAYTDKEKTVFHATVTADHLERALELLLDITFNPTFSPTEIKKEKQVIAEEIDMYADNPEESIFEDFDKLLLGEHPLGHPILGTKEVIGKFERENLLQFVNQGYANNRVVVSIVGNVTERSIKRLADKYLKERPTSFQPVQREEPHFLPTTAETVGKKNQQAYLLMGGPSYPLRHELLPAFLVLNNHLGGNAMNTLLNLRIRERHGLAYALYSTSNQYLDCGTWGIHAGCEAASLGRIVNLVEKELLALCQPMTQARVQQIKQQFLGSLQISSESKYYAMLSQGKDLLDYDEIVPFSETITHIEGVTGAELQEVAVQAMHPEKLSRLIYLPE